MINSITNRYLAEILLSSKKDKWGISKGNDECFWFVILRVENYAMGDTAVLHSDYVVNSSNKH